MMFYEILLMNSLFSFTSSCQINPDNKI
jgi:hypothetical protein